MVEMGDNLREKRKFFLIRCVFGEKMTNKRVEKNWRMIAVVWLVEDGIRDVGNDGAVDFAGFFINNIWKRLGCLLNLH